MPRVRTPSAGVLPFEYKHVEEFFQAGKARAFNDAASLANILASCAPSSAKALGRKVQGFKKDVWDAACQGVMCTGVHAKFSQNTDL